MSEQNHNVTSNIAGFESDFGIIELKPKGFSPKVVAHGRHPANLGAIENADGYAEVYGWCGEKMEIFLQVAEGRIADARFVADGCLSTMACGDMITILAKGLTLAEAASITPEVLQDALDGLPPQSVHCSELSVEALNKAIAASAGET